MPYKDSNKAKEYRKKYYLEHSKELIGYQKTYRVLNKDKISKMKKTYYLNNLDVIKERKKANYNPERIKKRDELYYKENREKVLANKRRYYLKNKEILSVKKKIYVLRNKEKIKVYHNSSKQRRNRQIRERRRTDLIFRLKDSLKSRTNEIFRKIGQKKPTSTEKLLGGSYVSIKVHIEQQFKKGMSWSNYGKWQIDHIMPLASAKDEKTLRGLCLYTNLQPLWAAENNSKKDKIFWEARFNVGK